MCSTGWASRSGGRAECSVRRGRRTGIGRSSRTTTPVGRAPHRVGHAVWAGWVSAHHRALARRRLDGASQTNRTTLVARRPHSAAETAAPGPAVLADGSCIRQRPEYRHHVWAYDFVADCTHDGRPLKILTLVEEYSRECLAIVVARGLRSIDVLETLAALFVTHGVPAHLGPTTARSSRRSSSGSGSRPCRCRRCSSSRVARGRTGMSNHSTASCGMHASTGNLLDVDRSPDLDRTMATGVQHGAATQCPGLPAPRLRRPSAQRH